MVMPSLTALLADSAWKVLSNLGPFLGTILLDKMQHHSIFFFSPGAFDQVRVENLLPPVETLNVGSAWEAL